MVKGGQVRGIMGRAGWRTKGEWVAMGRLEGATMSYSNRRDGKVAGAGNTVISVPYGYTRAFPHAPFPNPDKRGTGRRNESECFFPTAT